MDFVSRLIQEGYSEEEIGDILESIYLIEKNGGENFLAEEAEYIVEVRGFIARQLAKLRGLPQTPAIRRQIERLKKMGSKGDDVAQKADDAGGAIVKKADDVVDATKPPGFAETRPGSSTYKPSSNKSKPTNKKGDTPTPPATPTPKPKPKPKGGLKSNLGKAALLGAGAATYLALTKDGKQAPLNSDENVATSDNTPGSGDPGAADDQKNKDTSTAAKHGIPKAPFWWSSTKPKSLGYMANPGLASYRNVRRNEAYEIVMDYLLSEGHADTIQEAEYVMNQMEFDHICEIVERYTLNE